MRAIICDLDSGVWQWDFLLSTGRRLFDASREAAHLLGRLGRASRATVFILALFIGAQVLPASAAVEAQPEGVLFGITIRGGRLPTIERHAFVARVAVLSKNIPIPDPAPHVEDPFTLLNVAQ